MSTFCFILSTFPEFNEDYDDEIDLPPPPMVATTNDGEELNSNCHKYVFILEDSVISRVNLPVLKTSE